MGTHSLTMWGTHKERWGECKKCELHKSRYRIVLGRGTVPSEILICGEAPGTSEDSSGSPFDGPAGFVFNQIMDRAIPSNISYGITNLICCIPVDEEGNKTEEPGDSHIVACSSRLEEFIRVCDEGEKLKFIVTVGNHARDWLDQKARNTREKPHIILPRPIPSVHIYHPSFMIRKPIAQKSMLMQDAIVTIQNAIEKYITFPSNVPLIYDEAKKDEIKYESGISEDEIPF